MVNFSKRPGLTWDIFDLTKQDIYAQRSVEENPLKLLQTK
jgi:hypothetical protein